MKLGEYVCAGATVPLVSPAKKKAAAKPKKTAARKN
jgi:hypothetical protein